MNIILAGAGKIGFTLAQHLTQEGHSITVIDHSKERIALLNSSLDVITVCGDVGIDLLRLATGKTISVDAACDYLSEVGLCARDYIHREVNASLSGGELKRIEIATILARGTRLSVFDEPEAGIDLWSFQSLIRVFQSMRESISGSSILVISHQERILEIADEIIVVADGRIDRQGPRDEILPGLIGTASALTGCNRLSGRS